MFRLFGLCDFLCRGQTNAKVAVLAKGSDPLFLFRGQSTCFLLEALRGAGVVVRSARLRKPATVLPAVVVSLFGAAFVAMQFRTEVLLSAT